MPINTATARWEGNLPEGSGWMKTGRGGLQGNYSFKSRFEEGEGTNPEELIGAAHAGCFSMAFANALSQAGFVPTSVDTTARVKLEKTDSGFAITSIALETTGNVPGVDEGTFQKIAEDAKVNCPVSKLVSPGTNVTLTATLVS
ncbi:OsmC family protein [Actinoplanes sp. NPDC051411]|uniref:OsmC family protein n=1 Tax=Actinoplanes sp. NPDC051411 TaxID=3155522 RepID=UPI00342CEE2B